MKFYPMKTYDIDKIELIRLQIGCMIKHARLKKGISQEELALSINSTSTTIGRIERAEHNSSWDLLLLISNYLDLNFGSLFTLIKKDELHTIVKETIKLERKLTNEKNRYYETLLRKIQNFN